jgi:hypothetical protein
MHLHIFLLQAGRAHARYGNDCLSRSLLPHRGRLEHMRNFNLTMECCWCRRNPAAVLCCAVCQVCENVALGLCLSGTAPVKLTLKGGPPVAVVHVSGYLQQAAGGDDDESADDNYFGTAGDSDSDNDSDSEAENPFGAMPGQVRRD